MAALERRGKHFRVIFYFDGRKHHANLRTTSEREARGTKARLEENLSLLERGRLEVPADADLSTFLMSDGKLTDRPTRPASVTLGSFRDQYLEAHEGGAVEANSFATIKLHFRHVLAAFGEGFKVQGLTHKNLQRYVNDRSRSSGRPGKTISPITIRKELATFRAAWNWATRNDLLTGVFPSRGLKYAKTDERPQFMTRVEIERKIATGALTAEQQRELWDCLYLTRDDINQILELLQSRKPSLQPFLYPMVAFAAHTGARRSEMLRMLRSDIDLDAGVAVLREKKRSKDARTLRSVPLTPFLEQVLRDWLSVHPGGPCLFTIGVHIARSIKYRTTQAEQVLTKDEAHRHLRRALAGSRWQVLRGWHTFRHSMISNAASVGIDQRFIDTWSGHTTEAMRKRYRHLLPDEQKRAIERVFAGQPS